MSPKKKLKKKTKRLRRSRPPSRSQPAPASGSRRAAVKCSKCQTRLPPSLSGPNVTDTFADAAEISAAAYLHKWAYIDQGWVCLKCRGRVPTEDRP